MQFYRTAAALLYGYWTITGQTKDCDDYSDVYANSKVMHAIEGNNLLAVHAALMCRPIKYAKFYSGEQFQYLSKAMDVSPAMVQTICSLGSAYKFDAHISYNGGENLLLKSIENNNYSLAITQSFVEHCDYSAHQSQP
jgi:hypothetical protein